MNNTKLKHKPRIENIENTTMEDVNKVTIGISMNTNETKVKKKKKNQVTKGMLLDTRADLLNQIRYINKTKEETEKHIMNGSTVFRKLLIDYNN